VDQIIEMISMIVMDVVSIQGPPSISMIQILPGGNREHQQLPQWERILCPTKLLKNGGVIE
jgi:hypothetical protein